MDWKAQLADDQLRELDLERDRMIHTNIGKTMIYLPYSVTVYGLWWTPFTKVKTFERTIYLWSRTWRMRA